MPEITELSAALDIPPGRRMVDRLNPKLRVVNEGSIVPGVPGSYIHHKAGGFAVVFHARDAQEEIALRAWKRDPPRDAAARVQAIKDFLEHNPLPYFVSQTFIEKAIFVNDDWHPALRMEWVEGQTMVDAVEKRLRDVTALRRLATDFENMVLALQKAGMAHGDLQHDNVLVLPEGSLKLVDYDSVWVPALAGMDCNVTGLEGYGHPAYVRGKMPRPFNNLMDTFAGLVVICSLRAIAIDPTLFQRFTKQNLLFRPEDLEDPDASPVFGALDALKSEALRPLLSALRDMCRDINRAEVLLGTVLTPKSGIVAPDFPEWVKPVARPRIAEETFRFLRSPYPKDVVTTIHNEVAADIDPQTVLPDKKASPISTRKPDISDFYGTEVGTFEQVIKVKILVRGNGSSSATLRASCGNIAMDNRVLDAVKWWEWRPEIQDGMAIESEVRLNFRFSISVPAQGIVDSKLNIMRVRPA